MLSAYVDYMCNGKQETYVIADGRYEREFSDDFHEIASTLWVGECGRECGRVRYWNEHWNYTHAQLQQTGYKIVRVR